MMALPSAQLIEEIEGSEVDYMRDRMIAIQSRQDNPEGIEIARFGNATCYYSKTMPWASFNTVKGLRSNDLDAIDAILDFYRSNNRKPQFEIVPSLVDANALKRLSERGFYPSGFHTSLYVEPSSSIEVESDGIRIRELREDEFDSYATIHCKGTGLSDDGIPYVAANNRVLYNRPGWKFYMAFFRETPAAVGVMYVKERIASLTFAATLPDFRNRGLQQSLLLRRVKQAAIQNCSLVVGQCSFLSQSHRNMERIGMKIGYVRTSWIEG